METLPPVEEDLARASQEIDPERAAYTAGLRALADVLDKHDQIPLPHHGNGGAILIMFLDPADARERMAAAAHAIPCDWRKNVSGDGTYFDLHGELDGLRLELTTYRDVVCKRVVTGTHEVTEMVKDPEKLAEVPEIEVTRTVEDVEWDCGSLLAPRPQAETAPKAVAAS
jgi:hypothetical protein